MSKFELEFRQNDEIFNNENFRWINTRSSGFLIELNVHDHRSNGELRRNNMTDIEEERDFLSERGMREFLNGILWPEETSVYSRRIFPENGMKLIDHSSTPGFQFPISLDQLVRSVLEIVWSIRNNARNQHRTVVPIQLNLVIYRVRQFQFLDDSIIFEGGESFNGRSLQRLDDSIILQSLEVVGLSKKAIQRLKEEKAEGSTDCSICLESVGVGEIVARMPCSHLFHTRCITRWLHKKPSCPLCRAPAC